MAVEKSRKVLLASPRGYCAGVERAVDTVEEALAKYGPPIYVRKEIVHNRHVVESLEAKGVTFVEENEEVPEGSIVVFSAHGVAPQVYEEAKQRNLMAIDATCPLVTKVHNEAKRYAREDYQILLIGHEGHEEVVGTSGEAPDHITIVDNPEHAKEVEIREGKVAWLSQTTLSVDETMETVEVLRDRYPNLIDPPSDDICYATQNRQQVVKQIAPDCDLLIVVGSLNSSNSVRLAEVGEQAGADRAVRVDKASELDDSILENVATVGLTSGASVPDVLVQEVLQWLAERHFDDVEEVETTRETLTFSLPKELRRGRDNSASAQSTVQEN